MNVKILHTADTHLRDVQFSRKDRGEDFTKAFKDVIQIAKEEKVAAIIHSGDLLDSSRPSPHIVLQVIPEIDHALQKARIPMYVAYGDHDRTEPHWALQLRAEPEDHPYGIHILDNKLIAVPETSITIYGQDFIGKTKERFLQIKDTMPAATILLWHTQVREFCGFYGEEAVTMDELPTDKYSLIALGDIHVRDYKVRGECFVGYPGSTELCKRDEPLRKTVTVFEIDKHTGRVVNIDFREVKTRPVKVFQLNKDEDVVRALSEIEPVKSQNPIILARYDTRIQDLLPRFYAALDSDKAILRLTAMPVTEAPNADNNTAPDKKPVDFLPEFMRPETEIYAVSEACLRPEAPINDLINELCDKRLKEES